MDLRRACNDEQAARVLVEPVHQPGTRHESELWIECEQRILQCMARIAGPRMYDQTCRLVDHQKGPVLEYDLERHGLRLHPFLHGQKCVDSHLLSAEDAVLTAQWPAIDLHRP